MSERQNTIWMNVTTSASWQRPPVGIIRVEQSLCYELGKIYGARFKRCIWQDGKFVEWKPRSSEQIEVKISSLNAEPAKPAIQPSLPLLFPILSRKQALLIIAQGLLSLIPGRLRPLFNRVLFRIRPIFVLMLKSDLTKRILSMLRKQAISTLAVGSSIVKKKSSPFVSPSIFLSGDVLISVGLDWDRPYYKDFYEIRKQTGVKVVSCCYDLIPVLYPQYCAHNVSNFFKSYFLEIADGSDLILCISKQSEKDLKEMLRQAGGATPPTHVFPLGDTLPNDFADKMDPEISSLIERPFILYVSTIERRKNHEILYRAYHLLCSAGKKKMLPKLVFVGMQGWGVSDLLKDIKLDPQTKDKIIILNHVNDTELFNLYKSAIFCVYPSFYEGWGLPVGEALAMGKFVLCSDKGALPEVGGSLVKYIDPWSPHAWAEAIEESVNDFQMLNQRQSEIQKNYTVRSWQSTAQSVCNAIQSIE